MSDIFWQQATDDLRGAVRRRYLATTLAKQDVGRRYHQSRIGAFWLTINMGITIGVIGLVFGLLFRAPMQTFLPFLAAGVIIWGFISTCINEGCVAFSSADQIILQVRMPLATHVLRVLLRNIIILAHNILIFPIALFAVGGTLHWQIFWMIPGFAILALNLFWMMLAASVICTRFRDMTQVIQNIMQVTFFLTPIVWMPRSLPEHAPKWIFDLNPFAHLVSLVRDPLLGTTPSLTTWCVSLVLLLFGWIFAVAFFGRYRRRIAYWL